MNPKKVVRSCAALAFALALQGCNCGGRQTHATAGAITLSPDLQFGVLGLGESTMRTATLVSSGSARVSVESLQVAAPWSACMQLTDKSCVQATELEVGESVPVQVTYTPTVADASDTVNDEADLFATADSETTPKVSIHLVGHAVAARLAIEPNSLAFEDVGVGDSKTLTLSLANKGVQPVVLSSPAISGGGVFAADLGKLSTTLERGGSMSLDVSYSPTTSQDDSGALSFSTDIGVQGQVTVPLTGHGLQSKVSFCFGLEGGTQTCLPDASGQLAGLIDFGVFDEGTTKKATVTLASLGNVQVAVAGTAASGAMTSDETARANPCSLTTPAPDFTFVPATFGPKIPNDPTTQDPSPPSQQSIEITYSPHHNCADDLADRGVVSIKTGTGVGALSFFLDLKGASSLGLSEPALIAWDSPNPTPVDYLVYNEGPGPLHVTGVEIVEADANDCKTGCEARATCATSSRPECGYFLWDSGPTAATVPGAPTGGKASASVGTVHYVPAALCGVGGVDSGYCFNAQTIRVCTRVTSDDPFRPKTCGELKGTTF